MATTLVLIVYGLSAFVLGLWLGEEARDERQKTKRQSIYCRVGRRER